MHLDLDQQSDQQTVARERVTQIFRYLQDLNRRRNPVKKRIDEQPWKFRFADLPVHQSVTIGWSPTISATGSISDDRNEASSALKDDFILKVSRPVLSDAPKPPEIIAQWLQPGWSDPNKAVQTYPSQTEVRSSEANLQEEVVSFLVTFQNETLHLNHG